MSTKLHSLTEPPAGFEKGLTIEHVLLSVTIVSNKESAGQFDDSCASQLEAAMLKYHGIERIEAKVLYQHTKIENHVNDCHCGKCRP